MRRRTLDLVFSVGGLLMAILLLVLGLVLQNQSDFAESYVKDQLSAQKITFTPKAGLSEDEAKASCLVSNEAKPLTTGKQAECYANEYIGRHVAEINDGKTYSITSGESRAVKAQLDEAKAADPDSDETKSLTAESAALTAKTDSLFRGEALRGLLLTSYGFSIFGERAGQAAMVCFAVALVLLLAALAGLVHAKTTSKETVVV